MSNHERSKQNKHVAFFKPKPALEKKESVKKNLDKMYIENGTTASTRFLPFDVFCRFAALQPGKVKDNTIKRELKQGKR
jgi:hypothetical protein